MALGLTPTRVCAHIEVSRQLLAQQKRIETFLRNELMAALGEEIQRVAINGSGTDNQPLGILGTVGIGSVIGGTDGLARTYANLCELEFKVADAKADRGHTAWLVSPKVRRKLRQTFSNGTGSAPLWSLTDKGSLLGHAAGVTRSVPDNLTKGTTPE